MERCLFTCYPRHSLLIRALRTIPLSGRSLLIKSCQSQYQFGEQSNSPLFKLLSSHDPVTIEFNGNQHIMLRLHELFPLLGIHVQDPLQSAIILDIIRAAPVSNIDRINFIEKGWKTELRLLDTLGIPEVDFSPFFDGSSRPIHSSLPYNPRSSFLIHQTFVTFREDLIRDHPTYFPRYTHKNMSRSTRREFERIFNVELSPDTDPIFGQDDWIRVYHRHGIMLEGDVEMRQKWYPSGAKPRTYFAMGGTAYRYARFLQEFFTDIVNAFPVTNHDTRLRPERLRKEEDSDETFLIYDLSSFTSNMKEQKSFMDAMVPFFEGVTVTIVDEVIGPMDIDLGFLLKEYSEHCVHFPLVSLERVPDHLRPYDVAMPHLCASLLGIFGNLMTSTLAHYLILSPLIDTFDRINVAGDDGLVPTLGDDLYVIMDAISLVGDCALEKTMRSCDEGAFHLKRPLMELSTSLLLGQNFVPPSIANTVVYLSGENVDPRYTKIGLEDLSLGDRLSTVGTDLSRFLRAVYMHHTSTPVDLDTVFSVYKGITAVAQKLLGFHPSHTGFLKEKDSYIWPVDPTTYDFLSEDPVLVWCLCAMPDVTRIPVRADLDKIDLSLVDVGDEFESNGGKMLQLLETLDYVVKEKIMIEVPVDRAIPYFYTLITNPKVLAPAVYKYTVNESIPVQFT